MTGIFEDTFATALGKSDKIADALAEGVLLLDLSDRITYVNPAAQQMLGKSFQELNGELLQDVIAFHQTAGIHDKVLNQGLTFYNQSGSIKSAQGVQANIAYSAAPFQNDEHISGVAYSFHDVTAQVERENRLQEIARHHESIALLTQRMMLCNSLPFMMADALNVLTRTLQVPYACVYKHIAKQDTLHFLYGKGWRGKLDPFEASIQAYSRNSYTLLGEIPTVIENLATDKSFPKLPYLLEHNVISGLSVAIPGEKRAFGLLTVFSDQKRSFSDDEVTFFKSVAGLLSVSVQQKRIELEATTAAKQMNEKQQAFKLFAIHDLEAPLRKMQTFSDYIRKDAQDVLTPESLNHLDRIEQSAEQMQAMLANWLVHFEK